MDPRTLLAPPTPLGYPAPFWFIELFKVLGFWLHMGPMHLWYAGGIIGVLLAAFGRPEAKTAGHHIFKALPFAVALGINFGVVPLLFTQVAYYQFFYVAGILMAWPWFSVIAFLVLAYYGVYLYSLSLVEKFPRRVGHYAGWVSAGAFLIIGFIFANNFSLMTNAGGWFDIFRHHNVAGSATGLALNTADRTLIPRWLFMFGMAITTVGAFLSADAAFLSGRETDSYRRYVPKLAWGVYTLGMVWYAAAGSVYIFGTRSGILHQAFANPLMRVIFPLTMVSPGLVWLLLTAQWKGPRRRLAGAAIAAQLVVLALNAISRQWVQNVEIARYRDLASENVNTQPGAIIFFLLVFAAGLVLTAWMISKIVQVNRKEAAAASAGSTSARSRR